MFLEFQTLFIMLIQKGIEDFGIPCFFMPIADFWNLRQYYQNEFGIPKGVKESLTKNGEKNCPCGWGGGGGELFSGIAQCKWLQVNSLWAALIAEVKQACVEKLIIVKVKLYSECLLLNLGVTSV